VSTTSNLDFRPKPIDAVGIRLGAGASSLISKAIIQRTTALRAYNSYVDGRDWMEKLAAAYVVALATRSADEMLMRDIQTQVPREPRISCRKCGEATIGVDVIRSRLFPRLRELRGHANALIHRLDDPKNKGVEGLNVQGVFDYSYHLFQENADALFGIFPPITFEFRACKSCRER
jgi:hypothetical protein